LTSLVVGAPEGGADRHRGQLAAGVLKGEWLAGHATVLLGEPGVEHAPEVDVTGGAARGEDNATARSDVDASALCGCSDAEHAPGGSRLADEARHAMLEENLGPHLSGGQLEGADQANAG